MPWSNSTNVSGSLTIRRESTSLPCSASTATGALAVQVGMVVAFILGVVAVAAFVSGTLLGLFTTNGLDTPFELPAYVLVIAALAIASGARVLWKASHRLRWPDGDPGITLGIVMIVLWYGGLAELVLWIVLRITGVVGPLLTDKGL